MEILDLTGLRVSIEENWVKVSVLGKVKEEWFDFFLSNDEADRFSAKLADKAAYIRATARQSDCSVMIGVRSGHAAGVEGECSRPL